MGFVRHIVPADGIYVDIKKVKVVINWDRPTTVIEVQSFLSLVGYYHRFVEGFSKIVGLFHYLTLKEVKFE